MSQYANKAHKCSWFDIRTSTSLQSFAVKFTQSCLYQNYYDVSHKPGGRLPLLSTRPAVTPATVKRAATNFAVWWTEAQWVWTGCPSLLPDSVATAIWTRALLYLSPARYPLGYRATESNKFKHEKYNKNAVWIRHFWEMRMDKDANRHIPWW